MIKVNIDGNLFSEEEIRKWESERTEKMRGFLQKHLKKECTAQTSEEFAAFKRSISEDEMRRVLKNATDFCGFATKIAVILSRGKRKISIAEIDEDFCDAQTLYTMFMETMLVNSEENMFCNLKVNPEHFLLKGMDKHTQEVIEISGGIPFPERFFIRYGDEDGLTSKKENGYPFQASGVAFLKDGKIIGGVRHQMKDMDTGCHVKLMVEFPALLPDANIKAHQHHLACEFYNWFSEFERRVSANG